MGEATKKVCNDCLKEIQTVKSVKVKPLSPKDREKRYFCRAKNGSCHLIALWAVKSIKN